MTLLARLQNFSCFEISFDLWKVDDKEYKANSGVAKDGEDRR